MGSPLIYSQRAAPSHAQSLLSTCYRYARLTLSTPLPSRVIPNITRMSTFLEGPNCQQSIIIQEFHVLHDLKTSQYVFIMCQNTMNCPFYFLGKFYYLVNGTQHTFHPGFIIDSRPKCPLISTFADGPNCQQLNHTPNSCFT